MPDKNKYGLPIRVCYVPIAAESISNPSAMWYAVRADNAPGAGGSEP
jgi:hypothetical protein